MLDWDDMAALETALESEIGQRTAEDAAANLARYATFRGMILQLDEVYRGRRLCERVPASSLVAEGWPGVVARPHVDHAQTVLQY